MDAWRSSSRTEQWTGTARARVAPVCDACVHAADVDGGGVALLTSKGVREVVYASDDVASALEDLQMDLAEGPCFDAATTRSPVLVEDVRDRTLQLDDRWPFFMAGASRLGIGGLFFFPLRIGTIVLGTLDLYRFTAGLLGGEQLASALRAADDLGQMMLDLGAPADPVQSVASRAVVHQAAGMVMVQLDVSIEQAMAHLRARAFVEGTSLPELSSDVVRGRRRFGKEHA
jgi:hypothetical protein